MKPIVLVSADGHAGGPIEAYRDYIEAHSPGTYERLKVENDLYVDVTSRFTKMSEETYEIIDERGTLRGGGVQAVLDARKRLAEIDAEGIAAEVLFPAHQASTSPCITPANDAYSPSEREVGARAYNRWLADFIADGEGRFAGVADTGSSRDMDATVDEVRWVAEHGIVSISLPNAIADPEVPPIYHERYEPFWKACADAGLVLSAHAGWGGQQGIVLKFFEAMAAAPGRFDIENLAQSDEKPEDSPLFLDLGPRRAIWQLMLGGVFDRYPDLKIVLTEVRGDWIPGTIAHLDARFDQGDTPLKMKPSEYWARNCAVAPSSIRPSEVEMRYEIGVTRLLFGADYPHTEGTWPNSFDWIRDALRGVSEEEARKILGENAIEIYGFDRAMLEKVAERIGPIPSAVLGDHAVDPRKIEHFHKRSGYSFLPEKVSTGAIDEALDEDLSQLSSAGI